VKRALLLLILTSCLTGSGNAVAQTMARSTPAPGNWIVSETTSPVDYSPVIVATTRSQGDAEGSAMELSIYCRNGRTYLVLAGDAIAGRTEQYAISYRINGDTPVQAGAGSALFGGIALQGDVINLLRSLPDEGALTIQLSARAGPSREGIFSLGGLRPVRDRLSAACKWLPADVKPRN
jgi:hypothetical protein